jgi:hypothetical protein
MESVVDEVFLSPESDHQVAFTVVPGFRIDKTVIQCQVSLFIPNQTTKVDPIE